MTPTQKGLAEWHTLATSPDPERLARLVAEGAVFHSPVVHTPQEGRTLVVAYLSAAAALDEIQVNGVDIITFDDAGKINDFKVMIRPIKAVNKVWEMMAAQLEKASAS